MVSKEFSTFKIMLNKHSELSLSNQLTDESSNEQIRLSFSSPENFYFVLNDCLKFGLEELAM
jgi:hypothetical protein